MSTPRALPNIELCPHGLVTLDAFLMENGGSEDHCFLHENTCALPGREQSDGARNGSFVFVR